MKKTIIILLLLLCYCSTSIALAATWEVATTDSAGNIYYVDTSNITYAKDTITFWVKKDFLDPSKNDSGATTYVWQTEVNLTDYTYRFSNRTTHYPDGVLSNNPLAGEYMDIHADSYAACYIGKAIVAYLDTQTWQESKYSRSICKPHRDSNGNILYWEKYYSREENTYVFSQYSPTTRMRQTFIMITNKNQTYLLFSWVGQENYVKPGEGLDQIITQVIQSLPPL
ncbi:MAG: hypothetical protein H6Q69_288 [Firmicutes bacterium]|nr:hypothetical protein [Bacillota bacterium]